MLLIIADLCVISVLVQPSQFKNSCYCLIVLFGKKIKIHGTLFLITKVVQLKGNINILPKKIN